MQPLRSHRGYLAFLGHRLSGLALALFLPVHFLLLGTALKDSAGLENALALTHHPLFRVAEWGLIVLLTLHLLFGLRVLTLEMTQWPSGGNLKQHWILPAFAIAMIVGVLFLIRQCT